MAIFLPGNPEASAVFFRHISTRMYEKRGCTVNRWKAPGCEYCSKVEED